MRLVAAAWSVLAFLSWAGETAPPPQSMAILGDSVSAGLLANLERQRAGNVFYHFKIFRGFVPLLLSLDKMSLAKPEFSWAEGIDKKGRVNGHVRRLRVLNPRLVYKNFSRAGIFSGDVATTQLTELRQWSRSELGGKVPDYVTLFVGSNDLCRPTADEIPSAEIYERNMSKILSTLLQSPSTRVLVLPLPRFDHLKTNVENAKVMGALGFGVVSRCRNIWHMAPLCKTLTHNISNDEKNKVRKKFSAYNRIIFDLVDRYRFRYGDRVRTAAEIGNFEIGPNDVSIDCFHPNFHLQNRVAESTWQATWWARD